MDKDFLSLSQAADLLHVTIFTLLHWDKIGLLPSQKTHDNKRFYSRSAIELFRQSQEHRPLTGFTQKQPTHHSSHIQQIEYSLLKKTAPLTVFADFSLPFELASTNTSRFMPLLIRGFSVGIISILLALDALFSGVLKWFSGLTHLFHNGIIIPH